MTFERVKELFRSYVDKRANSLAVSEGVFLHTDNIRISKVTRDLNVTWDAAGGVVPDHSIRPALLDALTAPENQGCSHLKYMLMYPDEYGVNPNVTRAVLRSYYETLWTDSVRARHLQFEIFQGQQTGESAVLIKVTGSCEKQSPLAVPRSSAYFGSSIFVAHTTALGDFRHKVIAQWLAQAEPSITDAAAFGQLLNDRALAQLSATVMHINPKMAVYTLTVDASKAALVPRVVVGLIVTSAAFFSVSVALLIGLFIYIRKHKIFVRKSLALSNADYTKIDDSLQQPLRGTVEEDK